MDKCCADYRAITGILEAELISSKAAGKNLAGNDYTVLSPELIYDYALSMDIKDVKHALRRQSEHINALVCEGLEMEGGANTGKVLLEQSSDVHNMARANTVAALEAWAAGSELPAIVNCGSVFQSIACCQPVMEYVLELGSEDEKMYRALAISNLLAIYLKKGGKEDGLSAAVCAGVGAGSAICYLRGGDFKAIMSVYDRALKISSGLQSSDDDPLVAAKFALGVEAGLLAMEMWYSGKI